MIYYNSAKAPEDNIIDRPYLVRSESKGGSTTNTIGVLDTFISTVANFPPSDSGASTSYFIYLPLDSYFTSTNTTSFSVQNETQSTALTILNSSDNLTEYTCKFFSTSYSRRNILEIHVGSSSNQAGDQISYEGYFNASMFTSTTVDYARLLDFNGDEFDSRINRKVVEIGVWDMDFPTGSDSVLVDHGLSDHFKIRDVDVLIRNDDDNRIDKLNAFQDFAAPDFIGGGIKEILSTGILLIRRVNSLFSSLDHDSTSINRGWIYIYYED